MTADVVRLDPSVSAPALRVTLGRKVEFSRSEASAELLDRLAERLSVPNPAHTAAVKRRGLAFRVPANLCALELARDVATVPRGAMGILLSVAREFGVHIDIDDRRVTPASRVSCRTVELRSHQRRALDAFLSRRQGGVMVLPAGGGKTRTALAVVAELRTPTLVLVSAVDLATQWVEQVRRVLGIEPGMVGAGKETDGDVTIATAQTLARWDFARLEEFLDRFGMLVVDECHHAACETFTGLVGAFRGERLLGLTATPDRVDGLGPMVGWYLGPEFARVTHAELIAAGHLIVPEVRELRTNLNFTYTGPDDWAPLLDALCHDDARDTLIAAATAEAVLSGHTVIVLTGRVEHAQTLAARLVASGVTAAALTGKTTKRARTGVLEDAREGRLAVIVATSLADEGLDVPRLSCVVLAFPAKAAGRVEQRIGRIMRPHASKGSALILDVVDVRVGVLANQARKRRVVFAAVLGGVVA